MGEVEKPSAVVDAGTVTPRTSSRSASDVEDVESSHLEKGTSSPPATKNGATAGGDDDMEYPKGLKLFLVLISIYLAIFLAALDRTIVATAIPSITNEFNSFGDIGWYGSSFLLTSCAFQLLFGRVYTFYSPKWVFIALIVVFEIGSAICGAAPNSIAFILGRAIAGVGSSGLIGGAIILMVYAAPLAKRPLYQGFIGAVFGVASVAGPLLGGVFTTKVTWRWCFYINLPIGAVVLLFLILVLETPQPQQPGLSWKQQINQLDPIGTAVFLPAVVCLLLALEWAGTTYAWGSWRIILLFVLFGVLISAFAAIQVWKQENGTLPPRILKQRSIWAGTLFQFCSGAHMLILVYYLPIWFQAIKGDSAIESGIHTLPLLLALVVAAIGNGIFVTKIGYYVPSMIFCVILTAIGSGIFTTFEVETGSPEWIGIQVLYGLGLGSGMQQAGLAAQTVLQRKDIPTGVQVAMFAQAFGGTLSISIGQSVLSNQLTKGLSHIPNFDPSTVVKKGATEFRAFLDPQLLQPVLGYYNAALSQVFYIAVGFACLSAVGAAFMEWKSVKNGGAKAPTTKEIAAEEAGAVPAVEG